MPTVEAVVRTPRAGRYLAQLCDHLGHLQHDVPAETHHDASSGGHGGSQRGSQAGGHDSPPEVRQVNRDGSHARIEFDWGRCVLAASPDALSIRVHAADARALAGGQELIARRVETIGRRDQLTVTWRSLDSG